MTLELATIPADLIESTPDHASEAPSHPASEPALEAAAEPANPVPHSPTAAPLPQETSAHSREIQDSQKTAYYPNDHFIHALYGGFMGMPDLPGILLRADLWDSFLGAYTNPEFSHHFAHIVFATA